MLGLFKLKEGVTGIAKSYKPKYLLRNILNKSGEMNLDELSELIRKRKVLLRKVKKMNESLRSVGRKQHYQLRFELLFIDSQIKEAAARSIFGSYTIGVIFDTKNGILVANTSDVEIGNRLGFYGRYDFDKIEELKSIIFPEDCVFVIGAHIGTLAVPLSKLCNKIVAFEPNLDSFDLLGLNMKLNGIANADLYNLGTFSFNGSIDFLKSKSNTGGSKVKPKIENYMYSYDNPEISQIEVVMLDDFIAKHQLSYPNVVVMDIEGAEYETLSKASETLKRSRCLYIEFVPHHLTNIANVNVEQFLANIRSHFNAMQVVGSTNIKVKNHEINDLLKMFFERGMCQDLLFTKE